jgi:PASTA domain
MNARTATPTHTAEHGVDRRRGNPRRIVVNEYVGQTAADAAQAIRRAGLRPGLERSLGCEPELVGQVVAQEPPAGSELARNAMVTLYVAAPGAVPDDERSDPQPARDPALSSPVAGESVPASGAQRAKPRQRRRRKPRPAETRTRVFDVSPTPVQPEADLAPVAAAMIADADQTQELLSHQEPPRLGAPDHAELPERVPDEDGYGELRHDELVSHADDVFAGRAGVRRRRVYPARRRLTRSPNHDQRRWRQ